MGRGHASCAIALARAVPGLDATVLDSARALAYATEIVAKAGLAERVKLESGDFWRDDLGRGYDVALPFHVAHGKDDVRMRAFFQARASAIDQGGRLVVMEQLEGAVALSTPTASVSLVSLNDLHVVGGSRAPRRGIGRGKSVKLLRTPGARLVIAETP